MQITSKPLSDTKVTITIAASEADLAPIKEQAVKQIGKSVKVSGFRPGKAPLSVLENQVDPANLQNEVLQSAVNRFYQQAIIKENHRTLANPEVEITKFIPFTELEFKATVEVMSKVKLGDYTKIKKTAPKTTVEAKEVDEVVTNLRSRVAKKESVERVAKKGDEVVIDFEGKDAQGNLVAGASGKDYALELGSKSFIPGFEEGLIGVKKGDEKKLQLTFPKDYHAKNLAGSKITFTVTVKEVKQIVLPAADDAFAASVGLFKSLSDLKADIKTQLQEQKQTEAANKLKDEIIEELVKKSTFVLPDVLVTDQVAMLEQDFRQNLTYRGITLPEYLKQENLKDEEEWKQKALKPQAERRVSVGMVLAEVSDKEKIAVTPEELAERIALHKQQYQKSPEHFDTPEMQREVASRILTEKTVEFLYQQSIKK